MKGSRVWHYYVFVLCPMGARAVGPLTTVQPPLNADKSAKRSAVSKHGSWGEGIALMDTLCPASVALLDTSKVFSPQNT